MSLPKLALIIFHFINVRFSFNVLWASEKLNIYGQPCGSVQIPNGDYYVSLSSEKLQLIRKSRGYCRALKAPIWPEEIKINSQFFGPHCDHIIKYPSVTNKFRSLGKGDFQRALKLKVNNHQDRICQVTQIADDNKSYQRTPDNRIREVYGYLCQNKSHKKTEKHILKYYWQAHLSNLKNKLKGHAKVHHDSFYIDSFDQNDHQINFSSNKFTVGDVFCYQKITAGEDVRPVKKLIVSRVNKQQKLGNHLTVQVEDEGCYVDHLNQKDICMRLSLIDLKAEYLLCEKSNEIEILGMSPNSVKKVKYFRKKAKELSRCLCKNPWKCPDHLKINPSRIDRNNQNPIKSL